MRMLVLVEERCTDNDQQDKQYNDKREAATVASSVTTHNSPSFRDTLKCKGPYNDSLCA